MITITACPEMWQTIKDGLESQGHDAGGGSVCPLCALVAIIYGKLAEEAEERAVRSISPN